MGRTHIFSNNSAEHLRQLQARKTDSERKKIELVKYLERLKERLRKKEITYARYLEILHQKTKNKTIEEWIYYYHVEASECNRKLQEYKKSKSIKKHFFLAVASVMLIILIVFLLKNLAFTGFVFQEERLSDTDFVLQEFSDEVNLKILESGIYEWTPENSGILNSVFLSGIARGQGEILVYLEDILILNTSNIKETRTRTITGFAAREISPDAPVSDSNQNKESSQQEDLSPSQENSPQEEETREIPSQPEPEITEPQPKEEPEINQTEQFSPSQPGQSSNKTNQTFPEINETQEHFEEESSKETSPSQEPETSDAPEKIKYFEKICEDSCNLTSLGLNKTSYDLRIEISENSELQISEIIYKILRQIQVNETVPYEPEINATEIKQENTTQFQAIIGQPVKWEKVIKGSAIIKLPKIAENITAYKILESGTRDISSERAILDFIKREIADGIEITLNEIADYEINYYTQAPQAFEEKIENGKRITITGPDEIHYENVLAFTELEDNLKNKPVKLYHIINKTRTPVEFSFSDKDNDSLIDSIEWIVPHLSNETFEIIIEITKAEHLDENRNLLEDVYDYVKEQDGNYVLIPSAHYLRISFEKNLTNANDITIYARAGGDSRIEVYEKDRNEIIAVFENVRNESWYKVYLDNLTGEQDSFDLRISGDAEFDYVVDPTFIANNEAHDIGFAVLNGKGLFVRAWCDDTADTANYTVMYTNGTILLNNVIDGSAGDSCRISVAALNSTAFTISWIHWVTGASTWNITGIDINGNRLWTAAPLLDMNDYVDIDTCAFNSTHYASAVIDDSSNDALFEIWDRGTEVVNQGQVDSNAAPDAGCLDQDCVSCTALSSTSWVFAFYDDSPDNLIYSIHNAAGTETKAPATVSASALDGAVSTATLANGGFVIAYCESTGDTVSFITYDSSGTSVSGVVVVNGTASTCSGAGGTHVDVAALNTPDSQFVVIYDNTIDDKIYFAVYNYSGTNILGSTFISSSDTVEKAVAVAGYDYITGKSICDSSLTAFIVGYNDATDAVWTGYYANGTTWSGACPIMASMSWNQSAVNLGTVERGANRTANATIISNMGANSNVFVTGVGGSGVSFILATPTSIGSMNEGQTKEIMFNCSPLKSQAPGYYEAVYKVNSTENSSGSNIIINCTVQNAMPNQTSPALNSTSGNNYTTEDLMCWNQTTYDADGDVVKSIYNWYKNETSIMVLNMPFESGSVFIEAEDALYNFKTMSMTDASGGYVAYTNDSTDFRVDDGGTESAGYVGSDIATDLNNDFVIAWSDRRTDITLGDIYARKYDRNGNPAGADFRVDTAAASKDAYATDVAADQNNGFIITWMDQRQASAEWDIYARMYYSNTTAKAADFIVDNGAANSRYPAIAIESDNEFVITYHDDRNGNMDIFMKRYYSDGTQKGADSRVDQAPGATVAQYPAVARDSNDNFTIVWQDLRNDPGDLFARRYDSSGNAVGDDFRVDNATGVTATTTLPDIAFDKNDDFVIAWEDNRITEISQVYARRYWSNGTAKGVDFKVNSGTRRARAPKIAFDQNSNYIITWFDNTSGNYDTYSRRYYSDGTAMGTDFKVDTDATNSDVYYGDVATDLNNNFIITWQDYRGADYNVYARSYIEYYVLNLSKTLSSGNYTVRVRLFGNSTMNQTQEILFNTTKGNWTKISDLGYYADDIFHSDTYLTEINETPAQIIIKCTNPDSCSPVDYISIILDAAKTAKDYSVYGNDGTVYGAAWNSTGGYDGRGAYQFDGVNDFVNISFNQGLNFTNKNITVSAWAKRPSTYKWSGIVTQYVTPRAWALIQKDTNCIGWYVYNATTYVDPYYCSASMDNSWTHMVGTYNGTHADLWVDGILRYSSYLGGNINSTSSDIWIGRYDASYYNGTIDEVRIYNYSLSAAQILALYQNKTNMIMAEETAKGDNWKCSVTPNDGYEDGTTLNSSSLTILNTAPTTPVLDTPIDNYNTIDTTPFFNWTISTDADGDAITYGIEIANNSAFGAENITQSNYTLTANNYTATTMTEGTYYWRVKAITSDANSSYTDYRTFRIGTTIPTFSNAVNTSVDFKRYSNFTANITITNGGVGLDAYIFSTNASGSWANDTAVDISGTQYNASTSRNITGATRGQEVCWYYWANDTLGNTGNSSTYCFTVANTAPNITYVSPILNTDPVEAGARSITFYTTAYDADGVGYINDTSIKANFTRTGQTTRENLTCSHIGDIDSNSANYSCTINMWYFDEHGDWNITVYAEDNSGESAINSSTYFQYNLLQAIAISPDNLDFSVSSGAINQTANNDPTLINNTGNVNLTSKIAINAINLLGETNPSEYLPVANFSVSITSGEECAGDSLQNATDINITGIILEAGNLSAGQAQEELYYCIKEVPLISTQTYSTQGAGTWTIKVILSLALIITKKRKKKKKRKLLLDDLSIPITIFTNKLGGLEGLVRYLKENLGMNYHEIAELLNRNDRTIWTAYNKAMKKQPTRLIIRRTLVFIPISIFKNRKFTILEAIAVYLKDKEMKYIEIANLLNRDQRNIWTIYSRAIKKT